MFNKQERAQEYTLILSGMENARIEIKPSASFSVEGGQSITLDARVSVDPELVRDVQEVFKFVLIDTNSKKRIQTEAQIFLPE